MRWYRLDEDSRFAPVTRMPRILTERQCYGCGEAKLYDHSRNADGTRVVECLECGRFGVRGHGHGDPRWTMAAVQIAGDYVQ